MAGKILPNLHRALMGVTPTLHNKVVGGNIMGGMTGIATATLEALALGQHQSAGRGITGWSALKKSVKSFGTAATTQEFFKKLLKWQADVGGGVDEVRDV